MALPDEKEGRLSEAESLYKQAIAAYEKSQGPEHPFVATTLENLARQNLAQPAQFHRFVNTSGMAEHSHDSACPGVAGIWCVTGVDLYDRDALAIARDRRARLHDLG